MSLRNVLAALALTLTLAGCGEGGPRQPAQFELYTRSAMEIRIELRDLSEWDVHTIQVGPVDAKVPVELRWRSGFDDRNCERLEEVRIARTGGPENVSVAIAGGRDPMSGCFGNAKGGGVESLTLMVDWVSAKEQAKGRKLVLKGDGTFDAADATR